ncbi:MAG: class I SAM-dependent methyltransferase [Desulfovibrio sp.]|nr:class I SAM-dependent methyltransferase [Desulfovibrio sp.]MBI4960240.1 class I SAM-dependent methyltransferase [Desulfovibrio sp.]
MANAKGIQTPKVCEAGQGAREGGPQTLSGVARKASGLLVRWSGALLQAAGLGPVLDVACGDGRNGLYLAGLGARVVLVDKSSLALESVAEAGHPENVRFMRLDLETPEPPVFEAQAFGAVMVFRYLHRPLIGGLRDCLIPGGMFVYETYLEGQEAYGKPRNPDHLLGRGELAAWFEGWEVLEHYEGFLDDPPRVMGRIVCRKPSPVASGACP